MVSAAAGPICGKAVILFLFFNKTCKLLKPFYFILRVTMIHNIDRKSANYFLLARGTKTGHTTINNDLR